MSTTAPRTDEDVVPPSPPRRSRWRRLRKLAQWFFGTCAVIVLVLAIGRWQLGRVGERQLEVETQRLDANEPGWRWEAVLDQHKKAELPAAGNSAPRILDLAEQVPGGWRKWHKSEPAKAFWARASDNHLPPPGAIEAARAQAGATLAVRAEAVRLRDMRGGAFALTVPDDPTAMAFPHRDKCLLVAQLLRYDAYLALACEKDPNRGISAARAALAVARALGDEPFIGSQEVRIACASLAAQTAMRVLAWGEPTEELAELQVDLLAEADVGYFRTGMRGQRATIDHIFRGLENGTLPTERWFLYAGIEQPGPKDYAAFRVYRPLMSGDHAQAVGVMTRYVEASKLPPHEQLAALKQISISEGSSPDPRYIVARNMATVGDQLAGDGLRCRAELLAAAAGVACERFRQKNDRWPRDLDELVPAFLQAVPPQPLDGKPLGYRAFADLIAVFAFWRDSLQGTSTLPADFGQGGVPAEGVGYRVWDLTQRGLSVRELEPPERGPVKKAP